MKGARSMLFVAPRNWRGSIQSATAAARRFDAAVFSKSVGATFETMEPVVIVGANDMLAKMLRARNRVERLQ